MSGIVENTESSPTLAVGALEYVPGEAVQLGEVFVA